MTSVGQDETIADISSADLNYDKYMLEATAYENLLVTPVSSASVTCASAGSNGQTITFYLEPGIYNLSRSFLTANMALTKSSTNTRAPFFHACPGFFTRVTLSRQAGGSPLCDIQYLEKYLNAVGRQELSLDEVQSMDSFITATTVATSEGAMGTFTNSSYLPQNVLANMNVFGRGITNVITNINEPKYIVPGNAVDEDCQCQVRFPLSLCFNSILSLDRAFAVSERLTLQFTMAGAGAVGYFGTSLTDPTWAENFGDITISNQQLFLATVSNQLIAKKIQEECMMGVEVMIPNVTYSLVNYSASTSQNPDIRITRDRGKYITKLFAWNELATLANTSRYYALSNFDTTKAAAPNTDTGTVVTSLVTKLNGKQIESQIMDETTARKDSFNNARELLKGSCIFTARSYYYNWCYRLKFKDSFNKLNSPTVPNENHTVGGVEVPNEVRWLVQANTASLALNWYLFAALDKPYMIKNGQFIEM